MVQVNSWGGTTKQFSIDVSSDKLIKYNVSLDKVIAAISNANMNVGGREITLGPQSTNIRGIGLIDDGGASDFRLGHQLSDIKNITISATNGIPVQLQDVASIQVGNEPRLGIVGVNEDDDAVTAKVVIGRMFHVSDILPKIEEEIQNLNESGVLQAGVRIEEYYDRSDLATTIRNSIFLNISMGMIIVFAIQWLIIGDYRAALTVCANIPLSYSVALLILYFRDEETNLLSISAIDFGIIIDSSVILVENIFNIFQSSLSNREYLLQRLSEGEWGDDPSAPTNISGSYRRWTEAIRLIYVSSMQVAEVIFYATIVTIVTFLPIFLLPGAEAYLFGPMARGYCYALVGAFLSAIIISPVLTSMMLPKKIGEMRNGRFGKLRNLYLIVLKSSIDNRQSVVRFGAGFMLLCIVVASMIGVDFIPTLEEQNIFIKATLPRTLSLEGGMAPVRQIREIVMRHSEVEKVVSHLGRPDNGSEPFAFHNAQFLVTLKDLSRFNGIEEKQRLRDQLSEELHNEVHGIVFSLSQYVEESIDDATYGISSENAIRIFGKDISEVERVAQQINNELSQVNGIVDIELMHSIGQQNLDIKIDRNKASRYGLNTGEINREIQSALSGNVASVIYEGDRLFDIVVRVDKRDRETIEKISNLPISFIVGRGPGVAYVPLKEIADINLNTGSSFIYRDSGRRHIAVRFSVRNRDLESTTNEIKSRLANNVRVGGSISIKWEGDSVNLEASYRYLWLMALMAFLLVYVVLFSLFNSPVDSLVSLAGVPFMAGGGMLSLYLSGNEFSIPAAIGFISLSGIATMDGVFNILRIRELSSRGVSLQDAVFYAAEQRVRPMILTAFSAAGGFLPAILIHDVGSHIQRPIAVVVVGGCLLGTAMLLLITPAVRALFLTETKSSKSDISNGFV